LTTSVVIQGANLHQLEDIRHAIFMLLQSRAADLAKIAETIPSSMISHLGGTLLFWFKHLKMNQITKELFTFVKTLEAFSFWEGYIEAGGKLPPPIDEVLIPKSTTIEIASDPNVCCIIPIGYLNGTLLMILRRTLAQILSCKRIKKTVLVFDGTPNLLDLENEQLDTIEIPSQRGPAYCRNMGIQHVMDENPDVLFFIDADVLLKHEQPIQLIKDFLKSKSHIGLPLIESLGNGWMDRYHDVTGTLNGRYLESTRLLYATSCCTLMSSEVVNNNFNFAIDFTDAAGEDIDFSLRCLKAGYRISGLDSTKILHWYGYADVPESDLQTLRNRFHRYGAGERVLLTKHPDYYSFLGKSMIRAISRNLPGPSHDWHQFIEETDCVHTLLKLLEEGE
jgi:hypothetical protein